MSVEQFLRSIPLFYCLEGHDLAALAASAHTRTYGRGDLLPQPAYPAHVISFVEQGSVRLYLLDVDGRQLTVSVRRPGDYFWQISRDPAGVPESVVEAIADTTIVHIFPRRDFDALVARYPALALALIADLSLHLGVAYARLKDAALCTVEVQLAHALVRLAGAEGQAVVHAGHEEMAAEIGIGRDQVSKGLRHLRDERLIAQQRHHRTIELLQPERLRAL